MAINSSTKFGVVYSTPSDFVSKIGNASNTSGKLYVLQGNTSGGVTQGIYMVESNSNDPDGMTNVTMLSSGALATSTNAGLMSSSDCSKLAGIEAGANKYSHPDVKGDYNVEYDPTTITRPTQFIVGAYCDGSKGHISALRQWKGDVGSVNKPIYFINGIPTELNYTIETSVPANAVFTDTWRAIKVNGTEKINSTTSTALDISGGTNIDVSYNNSKVVISVKNVDASTADTADKVANSLTIKGGGSTVKTFNGSTATTIEVKTGDSSTLTVTGTNDGSITITPVTAPINASSNALTTGKQVVDYVATQLGNLSGALIYRGTVDGSSTKLPTTHSAGDVYVASASFTTTTTQTGVAYTVESGDYFISNGTIFNVVNGENQVSNKNATLTIGGSKTVATVDGTDITISLPSSGYYTHPASIDGSTTVSSSDGGDFAFSSSNSSLQVITGALRDASGHISKLVYKDVTLPSTAYSDTKYTHPASISGTTAADSSLKSSTATTLAHEGTFTVATGVYRDASGHVSKVATETFKLPSVYSHPAVGTTNTACSASANTDVTLASGTTFTVVNGVYRDASGHVNKVATTKYTMPSSAFTDTKCTSLSLSADTAVEDPSTKTSVDVILNVKIDASGTGTSLAGGMSAVKVPTQKAIDDAKAAAISAATIYWETL